MARALLLCCAALLAAGTVRGEAMTTSQPQSGSPAGVTTQTHRVPSLSPGTTEPPSNESSTAPLPAPHTTAAAPSSTLSTSTFGPLCTSTGIPLSNSAGTPSLPVTSGSAPPTSAPSNPTTLHNHTQSPSAVPTPPGYPTPTSRTAWELGADTLAQPPSKANPGVVVVVCVFVAVLVGAMAMMLVQLCRCRTSRFQQLDEVPMGKVSEGSPFARLPPR